MAYNYGSWNPYGTGNNQVQGGYFGDEGGGGDGGGDGTGGGDPEPFNWDDFASSSEQSSKSFSGLPGWASEWMKGWWPSYNKGMSDLWAQYLQGTRDKTNLGNLQKQNLGSLQGNVSRMRSDFSDATSGLEDYIEKSRQLMPQQYLEQMKLYNERAQQPVLNRLSNRGILNSSVTGGALSDILRDTQAKYSDEATKADLWAANQGYDLGKYRADTGLGINKFGTEQENELSRYFTDKNLGMDKEGRDATLQHFQTQFGMLPQLLAALRESQSESSGSAWGGLIELLRGGYE
jgi:hypothetical protein